MAASLTSASDAPRPVPVPAQAPVNILLVDDQPGRLLTYRAILEPLGERLVEAASGEQALKLLMEDEFAVILLDVNMPGMDGFETASLIHQHPRFEKTPIIFVTAVNVGDMDRLRGYKLGAVDYVSVPVIPEILRTKVTVLAELYRKRRELQLANERLATANLALQMEKAQQLQALNASLARGQRRRSPHATPNCSARSPNAPTPRTGCASPIAARTNSWRPWRMSCATRWRRCSTPSTSAGCRRPTSKIRCRA